MTKIVQIGSPPIAVHIRATRRARRLSLRISQSNGQVRLTMPDLTPLSQAVAFATDQEGWLRKHLARQIPQKTPEFGDSFLYEGRNCVLAPHSGRLVFCREGRIYIPGTSAQLPGRLRGFLRENARQKLCASVQKYADALAAEYGKITLRDTRSRWGSCSSKADLMFSWRLIMAPASVLDYVAAHEVCHLREMNHSPAYWALVASVFPEYEAERLWLRKNGAALHRFKF